MTLDANDYRINVPYILNLTQDKNSEEIYDLIGSISVSTSVPIIIVCCYIGELYGFSNKLNAFIDRLKAFYCVTQVLNVNITKMTHLRDK